MNKIICYINKNYIDIYKNKKIYHYPLSSIKDDDVVDKSLFIKELKNKKIFSKFLSNNVDIYLNHKVHEKDVIYYTLIFEDLNCSNIKLFDTSSKLISPTIINNDDYLIVYFNDNYYKLTIPFMDYFIKINKIRKINAISRKELKFKSKIKIYYYSNSTSYFLN